MWRINPWALKGEKSLVGLRQPIVDWNVLSAAQGKKYKFNYVKKLNSAHYNVIFT
jgi:hypothetical protein